MAVSPLKSPRRLPAGLVSATDTRAVLSHNIAAYRQRNGLSQAALASLAQVKQGTLSTYERGMEPPIAVLVRLASALNLTLDQLLPSRG